MIIAMVAKLQIYEKFKYIWEGKRRLEKLEGEKERYERNRGVHKGKAHSGKENLGRKFVTQFLIYVIILTTIYTPSFTGIIKNFIFNMWVGFLGCSMAIPLTGPGPLIIRRGFKGGSGLDLLVTYLPSRINIFWGYPIQRVLWISLHLLVFLLSFSSSMQTLTIT